MNLLNDLHELCEKLTMKLNEVNGRLKQAGSEINSDDLSIIDKLTHSIKSVKTVIAMEEYPDGYSSEYSGEYSREGGWNYNRPYMTSGNYYGNSGARRMRDSMGRFTSRDGGYNNGNYSRGDGYSRDASRKKMVQKLETLMDDTMSEQERMAIEECINRIDK